MRVDDEYGNIYKDNITSSAIDLEYYRETLEGFERQLQVIFCYGRDNSDIDGKILANCCVAIRTEEYAQQIMKDCISGYWDEYMKEIGMLPADKES